jgi:TPP-dependent pyruvate/acetoin dehydrogenase alpha subunit
VTAEARLAWLRDMRRIRAFEEAVERANRGGRIPGFLHTSAGQEAVAVGVCAALRPSDYVLSAHRAHGHLLARGAPMDALMSELYGKADGLNHGKGGSMHVADFEHNVLGANGIVGACLSIAVGAGLSARLRGTDQVTAVFFSEGASTTGAFHEALNLASVLGVAVVFVCENNLYASSASVDQIRRKRDVAVHADAYDMRSAIVDGNDVGAVRDAAAVAIEAAREGREPYLLEAKTYRYLGHHGGDIGRGYRTQEEIDSWRARDPITLLEARLRDEGVDEERLDELRAAAPAEVEAARRHAEAAPWPELEEAMRDVVAD